MTRLDRMLSLGAALVASALLLAVYPAERAPAAAEPVPAAMAWPQARGGTVDARLPDGTTYRPEMFLDAQTSVGTATDADGRSMRLLLHGADAAVRQLRSVSMDESPWFGGFAVDRDVLAWTERTAGGHLSLWTVNLRDGSPVRSLTSEVGNALLDGVPHALLIEDGRLYWAATNPGQRDVTEIRSIALTGGPVDVRSEPGTWELSQWPWLVTGNGGTSGTTALRNMVTDRDLAVPGTGRHTTRCSPAWCQLVSLSGDGYRIELMHPDGTARELVASGPGLPAIVAVAPLDRFEVLSQADSYTDLTGTKQLLVFDLATRRTVQISAGIRAVSYNDGVLWWATGALDTPVWHTLDLRTV